jgi:hypothetical protein
MNHNNYICFMEEIEIYIIMGLVLGDNEIHIVVFFSRFIAILSAIKESTPVILGVNGLEKKHILILTGSPRRNGNSDRMARYVHICIMD